MENVTSLAPKEPDDEYENDTDSVNIQAVGNGWIVTATDEEGEEYTEVFEQKNVKGLLSSVKRALGVG